MLKNIKKFFIAFLTGLIYYLAIYLFEYIVYLYKDTQIWIK